MIHSLKIATSLFDIGQLSCDFEIAFWAQQEKKDKMRFDLSSI